MPDLFAVSSLLLLGKLLVGKTVIFFFLLFFPVVDQVIGLQFLWHSLLKVYTNRRKVKGDD